jgi:hypothetical protein
MKRSIGTALAFGVWLSATASAAALTYELHRPLVPSAPPPVAAAELAPPLETTASTPLVGTLPGVVHVHDVTIIGPAPRHATRARVSAPALPRDIQTMSCAGWRDLDIGSGRVQVCQ